MNVYTPLSQSGDAIPGFGNDKETVNKVKQLLDDFDYGDDDEIKVPAKQDKNGAKTPPAKDQVWHQTFLCFFSAFIFMQHTVAI